jgi:hypothetical protein
MKRALCLALLALSAPLAARAEPVHRAQSISNAITELDVERARQLLDELESDSPTIAFERARLAIYMGDCDTASAILSAPSFTTSPEGASLGELAKSCAMATAGGAVHEDAARGVWIRLQEERDGALVPFIVDVADRARRVVEKDLGVELPRPLRIDLVRDLFSLSAVSGLPVAAAETTGTVAVARWGRVTMITPRATPLGYPWEDTLAHEITHLALSRATRDNAPLWLQEGISKREETRWRTERPFDDAFDHDRVARAALIAGRAVGVDKIGPSIAMLPTPEAASTAFSEVTSFVGYWLEKNGEPALRLLLADLRNTGGESPDAAMVSVTGYPLVYWIRRWQKDLSSAPEPAEAKDPTPHKRSKPSELNELARRVRLGDLLFSRGHSAAALEQLGGTIKLVPTEPALRWRVARAHLALGNEAGSTNALGSLPEIGSAHGGWFALTGRVARARGAKPEAERAFGLGIALDPLAEDVACEGHWRARGPGGALPPDAPLPADLARRALCAAARDVPRE